MTTSWPVVVLSTGIRSTRAAGGASSPHRRRLEKRALTRSPTGSPMRAENGRLQAGDKTIASGEFVDSYGFVGRQGDTIEIDLTSSEFDPYLILFAPEPHEQLDNDDYQGSTSRSFLSATLPANGLYRVAVTSYQPGDSGAYQLAIRSGGGAATGAPPSTSGTQGDGAWGSDSAPAAEGDADPFVKQ